MDDRTLMPLELGNQWTFGLTQEEYVKGTLGGSVESEVTETVIPTASPAEPGVATVTLTYGGQTKPFDQQDWLINSTGIYQKSVSLTHIPFSPPQTVLLFHQKPDATFDWTGDGLRADGSRGPFTNHTQMLPVSKVDTDMGPFMALPVQTTASWGNASGTQTTWFYPGIGIVRFWQEVNTINDKGEAVKQVVKLTLKNYALKKS